MRTKVFLALAVVLMLVASTTMASNMGFKISIPLAANVVNLVSLPYYNSYTTADAIFVDVGANVAEVDFYDASTNAWWSYFGWDDGPYSDSWNFSITPGTSYSVKVYATTNWIVVGSHNPGLALSLAANVVNLVSIPYHTTSPDAASIFTEVGANVAEVDFYDATTNAWWSYFGWDDGPYSDSWNFAITPGTGYSVKVYATTAWTPAHY